MTSASILHSVSGHVSSLSAYAAPAASYAAGRASYLSGVLATTIASAASTPNHSGLQGSQRAAPPAAAAPAAAVASIALPTGADEDAEVR